MPARSHHPPLAGQEPHALATELTCLLQGGHTLVMPLDCSTCCSLPGMLILTVSGETPMTQVSVYGDEI